MDWVAEAGKVPQEALWGPANLQQVFRKQPKVFLLHPDGGCLGHS